MCARHAGVDASRAAVGTGRLYSRLAVTVSGTNFTVPDSCCQPLSDPYSFPVSVWPPGRRKEGRLMNMNKIYCRLIAKAKQKINPTSLVLSH